MSDDNYVAWLRYRHVHESASSIHVCDSDSEGAFKVYRHPVPRFADVLPLTTAKYVEAMNQLSEALVGMIDAYNNLTDFGEECHAVVAARAALAAATGETK